MRIFRKFPDNLILCPILLIFRMFWCLYDCPNFYSGNILKIHFHAWIIRTVLFYECYYGTRVVINTLLTRVSTCWKQTIRHGKHLTYLDVCSWMNLCESSIHCSATAWHDTHSFLRILRILSLSSRYIHTPSVQKNKNKTTTTEKKQPSTTTTTLWCIVLHPSYKIPRLPHTCGSQSTLLT